MPCPAQFHIQNLPLMTVADTIQNAPERAQRVALAPGVFVIIVIIIVIIVIIVIAARRVCFRPPISPVSVIAAIAIILVIGDGGGGMWKGDECHLRAKQYEQEQESVRFLSRPYAAAGKHERSIFLGAARLDAEQGKHVRVTFF